jgi:hypothetical protein
MSIDGMSDNMRQQLRPPAPYSSSHPVPPGGGGGEGGEDFFDDLGVGEGFLSSLGINREQVVVVYL